MIPQTTVREIYDPCFISELIILEIILTTSNIAVQGGTRSFHLFRNFSKILKSRWKMSLKKLVDRGYFYIFHFYWQIFLTFTKTRWNFKCSNFCHWFLYFLQKVIDFPEFRQPTTSLVICLRNLEKVMFQWHLNPHC